MLIAAELSEELAFTACEDVNLLSKADALISNWRFPWEDKGNRHCGCVAFMD